MGKFINSKYLAGTRIGRGLLAFSLSASLAAVGCSTNRTPGNGEPIRDGFVRTAPTGGVTGGSEVPVPPPMTSASSAHSNVVGYVRPDQAAALMGEQRRVRVLGVSSPNAGGRPYESDTVVTGQFRNPALITNPQVTVNSSISSNATPVVIDGAAGDAGAVVGTLTADGIVLGSSGMISSSTIAASNATGLVVGGNAGSGTIATNTATTNTTTAPVILSSNGTVAPTSVVSPTLTPGVFAGGAGAAPTASVAMLPATTATTVANPSVTASGSGLTTAGGTSMAATTAASTLTAAPATTTAGARIASRRLNASASAATASSTAGVRAFRSDGRVVVTNVSSGNR